MRAIIRLGLLAGIGTLVTPAVAGADSAGADGRIVKLTINEPGSDDHATFRGAIKVRTGKKATDTYKWGGSLCAGLNLSEGSIARLAGAFHTRRFTTVKPRFKNGAGGTKCLVSFDIRGKANDGPS